MGNISQAACGRDGFDRLDHRGHLDERCLTTVYLLFVMELHTHRVNFVGCTTNPNQAWMNTIARELANHEGCPSQGQEVLDHGPRRDVQ